MPSLLARLVHRWRRPAEPPLDPTRPRYVVRDGVPIVHEGPPGFPGRPEADDDDGDGHR